MCDFLWGGIGDLEERDPLKQCKYVVMVICVHFPEVLEQNFWHLLYLNQQDTPTRSLQDIFLSLSLSLSLYLSIYPFPSLPLSRSPSFSPSPSPSPSPSLPLSLSLSLCRPPLLSSVCRQGKSCKKQIRRWVKTRMPPAKKLWERCLKRRSSISGATPQISRSRQTPRLGEKTAAASRLWRAWQKASNSCGKSRASACARKRVLQGLTDIII